MIQQQHSQPQDGLLLTLITSACGPEWQIECVAELKGHWISVRHARVRLPLQGWKLHISASTRSATTVIERVLPCLLAEEVVFKVASGAILAQFNSGGGGLSQIGKFITVYPTDERQGLRLAAALDLATQGLHGPAIPSDRPLRRGSLVYYRYGGFANRHFLDSNGTLTAAIHQPDGDLVGDERGVYYKPPAWAADPFVAAQVAEAPTTSARLLHGRFIIYDTLEISARGALYLAIDLDDARQCVIKRARHDVLIDAEGLDACDRLRHEYDVLCRLAPDPRCPAPIDLFAYGGDLFLAMEAITGVTLDEQIKRELGGGRTLPTAQIVTWGRDLADALNYCHAQGFILCDFKADHVIIAPDARLHIIDFEHAYDLRSGATPHRSGTPGYQSPQRAAGARPDPTDDIYSLGALLFYLATGADPHEAPRRGDLLDRPLELLRPGLSPALRRVIAGCLDPDPARRFQGGSELAAELAGIDLGEGHGPVPEIAAPERDAGYWSQLVARLGDTLCAEILQAAAAHEPRSRHLGDGIAGQVLALAALVTELGVPSQRAALASAAHSLASVPRPPGAELPGLYVGEAGVGLALLRAAQALDDRELLAHAEAIGQRVAAMPHRSPDLFEGSAGRLRFHLQLWQATGDTAHLRVADAAGAALLAAAQPRGLGEIAWALPPDDGAPGGDIYLGYAHGAAGIADALLDLFEATGDERYRAAATAAARWLARLALPALNDGSGLNWPSLEGEPPGMIFWCHGAAGVGRFFCHAARHVLLPEAADLAARAARTVGKGSRWARPSQCHGLAGNIEFLLYYAETGGPYACSGDVRALARLLEDFALERDGQLLWQGDDPHQISPDFLTGYAGVATCLLRCVMASRAGVGVWR